MKVLGVGLSRTGTTSLARALTTLGYKTLHWSPEKLRDVIMGNNSDPNWRRYNDVDAVVDLPAALFYDELLEVYPDLKCILTVRDESTWLRSLERHYNHISKKFNGLLLKEAKITQMYAYGSDKIIPYLALKRYRDHNKLVELTIPADQLLILDIERNDNRVLMKQLCCFLNVEDTRQVFPHLNKGKHS